MENKEEKVVTKTSGGVKALLVILILALIGTSGFIVYDKLISKDNESKSNTKEETKKEETKKESVKKIDESKEYVYDLEKGESYAIPYINIDSDDAKRLNNEIDLFLEENYFSTKNLATGDYIYILKYEYYINEDILSVIIKLQHSEISQRIYKAFNINKKTGKEITNEEILKNKNITREELNNKLYEIYEQKIENDLSKTDELPSSIKEAVLDETKKIFEETSLDEFELYIGNNNELFVSSKTMNLAGAKYSIKLFNLDTKTMIGD